MYRVFASFPKITLLMINEYNSVGDSLPRDSSKKNNEQRAEKFVAASYIQ
jgi:hypothetical protein